MQLDEPVSKSIVRYLNSRNKLTELRYGKKLISPYKHETFVVKSLESFIDIINALNFPSNNFTKSSIGMFCYRGISNYKYPPTPSISRDNILEQNENLLIEEFRKYHPEIFNTVRNNCELLSIMQHYGLPTRMLDFTENPLVALYFACISDDNENGRVLCIYDSIYYADPMSQVLCDMACEDTMNVPIDDFLKSTTLLT